MALEMVAGRARDNDIGNMYIYIIYLYTYYIYTTKGIILCTRRLDRAYIDVHSEDIFLKTYYVLTTTTTYILLYI